MEQPQPINCIKLLIKNQKKDFFLPFKKHGMCRCKINYVGDRSTVVLKTLVERKQTEICDSSNLFMWAVNTL